MARLPVPRPPDGSSAFRMLAELARGMAETGIEAAPETYARLNAIVGRLYQLTPEQYQHVVNSFPLLPEGLRRCCCDQYMLRTESQKHGNTV